MINFTRNGRSVVIELGVGHPENYLWLIIDGRRFFLGVRTPGMTRGDVKRMALVHPQLNGYSA